MVEEKVIIENPSGINARAAAIFVQAANKYSSTAWLERDDVRVNAKSIMGIISLALAQGDEVLLKVGGTDEQASMQELKNVLTSNLDE